MPLDYLSQVKPLEDDGLTDQQIADHLANRTVKPILCSDAKIVLEEDGLIFEDPVTGQRVGPLVDRYNAMTNANLKLLLGWFISHVFGRGIQISSDTNPRAIELASVIADLPAGMQSTAQKLLALGGGQPYAGTVLQDVTDARTTYQTDQANEAARAAKELIVTTCVQTQQTAVQDAKTLAATTIVNPTIEKLNAMTGWLSLWDYSAVDDADIQAYCDALLASADGNVPYPGYTP